MRVVSYDYTPTTNTETVSADHFGVNFLTHKNHLSDPGDTPTNSEKAVALVGTNILRYPGGTITEDHFILTGHSSSSTTSLYDNETRDVIALDKFLEYDADHGKDVIIVLPTGRYFDGSEEGMIKSSADGELRQFIKELYDMDAVKNGDVKIIGFELGNEWYQGPSNNGNPPRFDWQDATEFGTFSASMLNIVHAAIDDENDSGTTPYLYVQGGRDVGENTDIIAQFNSGTLAKVDGVIIHFYAVNDSGNVLNIANGIQDRLSEIATIWGGKDVLVSEWNVGGTGEGSAISGMMRNAALLKTFAEMVENGADIAAFWAVQGGVNTETTLTLADDPHPDTLL